MTAFPIDFQMRLASCAPLLHCSAKQLVVRYPAMCVAAWAYITAALSMGITALLFVERSGWEVPRQLLGPLVYWIFVCSVLGYYVVTWATQHLPASQVRLCLMLCVPHLVCPLHTASLGGHMLHACSQCLQRCDLACNGPACCSRSICLLQHLAQHCHQSAHDTGSLWRMQVAAFQCLQPFVGTMLAFAVLGEEPSVWDLGAIGIFIGLFLVVFDKKDSTASLNSNTGMRKVLSNLSLAQMAPFRLHHKLKSEKSGEKGFFSSIL